MASLNTLSAAVDTAINSLVTAVTNFNTELNTRDQQFRSANPSRSGASYSAVTVYDDAARYVRAAVASKPVLATALHLPPQNPAVTVAGVGLPD